MALGGLVKTDALHSQMDKVGQMKGRLMERASAMPAIRLFGGTEQPESDCATQIRALRGKTRAAPRPAFLSSTVRVPFGSRDRYACGVLGLRPTGRDHHQVPGHAADAMTSLRRHPKHQDHRANALYRTSSNRRLQFAMTAIWDPSRKTMFIGLLFFAWKAISKVQHLVVVWFRQPGRPFSTTWILIANGWMKNPVGASFNPQPCGWGSRRSSTRSGTRWRRKTPAHGQGGRRHRIGLRAGRRICLSGQPHARDEAYRGRGDAAYGRGARVLPPFSACPTRRRNTRHRALSALMEAIWLELQRNRNLAKNNAQDQ
jgi:hypothetical protein